MKKIAFVLLIGALAFGGCDLFRSKKSEKKPAVNKRAQAALREENNDVDFQAFVGRLKKAISAHDVNMLASMMTENFGYSLNPTRYFQLNTNPMPEVVTQSLRRFNVFFSIGQPF